MLRTRLAVTILSVALLGLTGCGGSDAPPAAAPAPAPATAAAPTGATPVAAGDASSTGTIGGEVAEERAAARESLRKWGRAATRACHRLDRIQAPYGPRFRAMSRQGGRVTKARLADAARVFDAYAKIAEREYDLVRAIALPEEPEALAAIDDFFQKEEEALMLLQRAVVEFEAADDPVSIKRTAVRFRDLLDDYRGAAKAVHAEACFD